MRRIRGRDANMRFLFGSVFFFFIIIVVIGLFCYFALEQYMSNPEAAKKAAVVAKPRYDYSVRFDKGFEGQSFVLYLNDSLLYAGVPVDVDTVIRANRLAAENSLLVVDKKSDIIVSIIELGKRGDVLLKYNNGAVSSHIKE